MKQLHNMMEDSTDWLNAKKGVDHLLKRANERLESWQEITYTVDALKKQNAELKVAWSFIYSFLITQNLDVPSISLCVCEINKQKLYYSH